MTESHEHEPQPSQEQTQETQEQAQNEQTHVDESFIRDPDFSDVTAEFSIRKHVAYAMGSGLIPIPLVDMAAVTAIQVKMVRELSQIYGVPFSQYRGRTVVTALIAGIGSDQLGRRVVGSMLKSLPLIGGIAGAASVPLMSGSATYAVGQVFRRHFANGGNLMNFDPNQAKDYFKQQYQKGREKVSEMRGNKTQGEPAAAS